MRNIVNVGSQLIDREEPFLVEIVDGCDLLMETNVVQCTLRGSVGNWWCGHLVIDSLVLRLRAAHRLADNSATTETELASYRRTDGMAH